MEVREKEMSSVSREKMTHLIRVPKSITDTNLHCIDNLTSKILVFTHTHTHTYIGHLLLKLCHRVLEIGPEEDKGNLQKYIII